MARIKISELPETQSLGVNDLLTGVGNATSYKITVKNLSNSLTKVTSSITADTASSADNFTVRNNLYGTDAYFTGTINADILKVSVISSSIIYSSGSNIFGDELTDTQQLTGSVSVLGSFEVNGISTFNGRVTANNLTGSLFGTSSWAEKVESADIVGDITLGTQTTGQYASTIAGGAGLSATAANPNDGTAYTIDVVAGAAISLTSPTSDAVNVDTGSAHFTGGVKNKMNIDGVVSSSIQVDHNATTNYVGNQHVDHSTITLTAGSGLSGGGDITANRSFDVVAGAGISVTAPTSDAVNIDTGSAHFTGGVKTKMNTDGVISGSSQVILQNADKTGFTGASSITTIGTVTSGDVKAILPLGVVSSSAFSSPSQGTLRATLNGIQTDVDLGVQIADNVQFAQITGSDVLFTGTSRVQGSLAVGNISPSVTVGRIDASNDVVAFSTSDQRLKTEITPIENALSKVMATSGVNFTWIENIEVHGNSGRDVGVIAQEIEAVLPEVVTTRDNGYKAVKYEKIVPLLIEAIKDLQNQINELKNK